MAASRIVASTPAASRRLRDAGLTGRSATTRMPTTRRRGHRRLLMPAAPPGGSSVATSAADDAACIGSSGPSSRKTAIDIAIATTTMICQVPEPIQKSPGRRRDADGDPGDQFHRPAPAFGHDRPSETTAAIGAKTAAWPGTDGDPPGDTRGHRTLVIGTADSHSRRTAAPPGRAGRRCAA